MRIIEWIAQQFRRDPWCAYCQDRPKRKGSATCSPTCAQEWLDMTAI